ncbi:hypothetical protein C8R45DRAFT_939769 [Mycena sanguinolenta]|nr:hypothetical protein C8R45DRAFT_939769 [Mycena sanguinolenta]
MSASYSKDRAVGIGIWQAPPNLSKEALENKLTTIVDKLVALPIAQKNYVKFEMWGPKFTGIIQMFQTGLVTEELMTHGVSEGPPSVWVIAECATVNASADRLVGLPIIQKNVIKHSMWVPHNTLDPRASAIGFPVPDSNIIVMIETEILKDSEVKQFMDDSRREWDIHVDSSFFVANVVTKINK